MSVSVSQVDGQRLVGAVEQDDVERDIEEMVELVELDEA